MPPAKPLVPPLHLFQVLIESIEALLPEPPITLDPFGDLFEPIGFETAGPPLRFAATRDEPRALQHPEVLGHGGKGHVERLRKLRDRCLALREPREDCAPRRVRQRAEGEAQSVGLLRLQLLHLMVK